MPTLHFPHNIDKVLIFMSLILLFSFPRLLYAAYFSLFCPAHREEDLLVREMEPVIAATRVSLVLIGIFYVVSRNRVKMVFGGLFLFSFWVKMMLIFSELWQIIEITMV